MAVEQRISGLRRKLVPRQTGPTPAGAASPAAEMARALSRVVSDSLDLIVEGAEEAVHSLRLVEGLDQIDPDAFTALVSTPDGRTGLVVIGQQGFASLIEAMTIGRLALRTPPPRRPTATDAALVGALLDAAFLALPGGNPCAGARFDRAVTDQRLLSVLLDDGVYTRFTIRAALNAGEVTRRLDVALLIHAPAPDSAAGAKAATDSAGDLWEHRLTDRVMGAMAHLRAELGQVTQPLSAVMALRVGDTLSLPLCVLEEVRVVDLAGHVHGTARLGQSRGMRALRLVSWPEGGRGADSAPPSLPPLPPGTD